MNIRHYLPKVIAIAAIAVLAVTNSCFGTILNVTQHNQEQTQWCWDASSQMVLEFFGHTYSQSAIAQWAVGGQNIPNYLYGSTDSSMHGCDEILDHFGSISSTGSASAMSLSTLASEISAGRPAVIRWGWDSGGGHILVVRGTDGNSVYLNDPWNGQSVNNYSWVYQGGGHTWTHTLKLASTGNEYYTNYQYYMSYANYYLNRYYSTGSSSDLYYAYYYYAYAGGYYYLSYGQNSQAFSWYYYYMSTANQVFVDYYYYSFQHSGSQYDLAYCYYYYAYVYYYYYLYMGNSSYANYYYSQYMYYAYYYYYL